MRRRDESTVPGILLLGFLLACPLATGRSSSLGDLPVVGGPEGPRVVVLPAETHQTITGWEATAQAGQWAIPSFPLYRDELFDRAVEELGINRLRLTVRSGAENPVDSFSRFLAGEIDREEWKATWFRAVNDDDDPTNANLDGFQFSFVDFTVEQMVLPMKRRLEARGERLFVNLQYGDFGSSEFEHRDHPAEYAELMLVHFQHLQSKYGFVPDAVEVILEPDTRKAKWAPAEIGRALVAAADRLALHGFQPGFIAPSTTNMGNAVRFFDEMIRVPGVLTRLTELSYHRYSGVSDGNLREIAKRSRLYGVNAAMLEHIGSGHEDLHEDLALGRNSAWQQFSLAFLGDNGAHYYRIDNQNPNDPKVTLTSQARFLPQYFRYVRAGALRIGASAIGSPVLDPLAFVNPNGKHVLVVKTEGPASFSVLGLAPGTYGVTYSTANELNVDLPDLAIGLSSLASTVDMPARGVMTIYGR